MKAKVFGMLAGLMTVGVCGLMARDMSGPYQTRPSDGAGLITLATQINDGRQQLTVIDPQTRAVCIYHIELASGTITLRSVRNITGDMQMDEFNGTNPLPREIRALLENR